MYQSPAVKNTGDVDVCVSGRVTGLFCDGRGGDMCKYERFDERYYPLHLE